MSEACKYEAILACGHNQIVDVPGGYQTTCYACQPQWGSTVQVIAYRRVVNPPKPVDPNAWHVDIAYREWVIYGFEGHRLEKIAPAVLYIDTGIPSVGAIDLPFEFPVSDETYRYVEFRRETKWGWRFSPNNHAPVEWTLANSKDEALKAARVWAEHYDGQRPGRTIFKDALNDIRELPLVPDGLKGEGK